MFLNDNLKKFLLTEYKYLINVKLPATYQSPVRFNHCFNRIILDWLFNDCWYKHLDKNKAAISQLSKEQLHLAINRMQQWLKEKNLLIEDNYNSLLYREKLKH